MGVSGCGKTTVGKLLAKSLGGEFFDGDDFHPEGNVEKMRSGVPLTDADRHGWLRKLNEFLLERENAEATTVLACSALKQAYRDKLAAGISITPRLVFLRGTFETIWDRMKARKDHYMPASLLRSQFETLEEPDDALNVDVNSPPEEIVQQILSDLVPKT